MEKIDISKIRGKWVEYDKVLEMEFVEDDTIKSIRLIAEKINEIIDVLNK